MSDSRRTQAKDHLGCETSERWLHRLYAGENTPETLPVRLLQHVETCAPCREEYESLSAFRADMPLLIPSSFDSEEELDDDPLFVNAVMAKVRDLPAPVRRREWMVRARTAALVTLSLIAGLLIALQLLNEEGSGQAGETQTVASGDHESADAGETQVAVAGESPDAVAGSNSSVVPDELFDPSQVQFHPESMDPEQLREWMPKDGQLVRHIPERKAPEPDTEDGWVF